MTVLAGVFQPASTFDADLIRIRSATSVVNASATTVADLARFLGFDCTIQGAATTSCRLYFVFNTSMATFSASSTVSITPHAPAQFFRQRNRGQRTTDVTFRPFRSMVGAFREPSRWCRSLIPPPCPAHKRCSWHGQCIADFVLGAGAGTAVAFVDGTIGAGIWSDVTVGRSQATPTSTWTNNQLLRQAMSDTTTSKYELYQAAAKRQRR